LLFLYLFTSWASSVDQPQAFSWDMCGGNGANITSLSETPDPVKLGDNLILSVSWSISKVGDSSSLTSVALHIDTKVAGVWVEVPCVGNIGSCTYQDPCGLLDKVKDQLCPQLQPLGIPCQCPIPVGKYKISKKSIAIQNPHISWLTDGDFYAKATVNGGAGVFFCLEVYVSISS